MTLILFINSFKISSSYCQRREILLIFSTILDDSHCAKNVQIRSFFWSVFSHIRTISPYSVRKRENTDQKKLHIWTLFMQCQRVSYSNFSSDLLINVTDSNYYGIVIVSLFYLKYIWWCWNMMFYKTHSARSIKLSVDAILSVLFWKAFLIATKPSLWDRLYIYI